MLRDYITEERVKGRVTSTTTENIAAQILLCDRLLQDLVTRCIYEVEVEVEVELQGTMTEFIYTVELHKHTSINNTN
ncbi:hypothetical protein LL01C5_36330 [Escherichia coli]|nr:hypothetical protein MY001_07550 [Escherichia coli]GHO04933.1 hypothetical protein MY009_07510 [Escherichia coli]